MGANHTYYLILQDQILPADNRHPTLRSPESPFVFASLCVARMALYNHLRTLLSIVNVYTFRSIADQKWQEYLQSRKVSILSSCETR